MAVQMHERTWGMVSDMYSTVCLLFRVFDGVEKPV
jgi:hypothetical protein